MNEWVATYQQMDTTTFSHKKYGCLSIDFKNRVAEVGMVKPRVARSIVDPRKYIGRGWREKIFEDATNEAERLWNT